MASPKNCQVCAFEDPLYAITLAPETQPDIVKKVYAELHGAFTEAIKQPDELLFYTDMRPRHVVMLIKNICDTLQVPRPWKLTRAHSDGCEDQVLFVARNDVV